MSATLSDDSSLVREIGCSANAARTPILPPSDGGIGERMVLAPSLIDPGLDRKWVMNFCKNLSSYVRVAVLSSSEKLAREWEDFGATVELGNQVSQSVDNLRTGKIDFVAFAQRYDGVDLPDDSCRILVLDGMPKGAGIAEDHDRSIPGRPGGEFRRWAYRIEQGMGRAVRSHADYAVIILAGPELCNFLAKRDVLELLGTGTRAQLELAEEMAEIAKKPDNQPDAAIRDMVWQCINRTLGWRNFYDTKVRQKTRKYQKTQANPDLDQSQIQLAEAEHLAKKAALQRDPQRSIALLDDAINSIKPNDNQLGWLLQRKANYVYEYNQGDGMEIQKQAYQKNDRMCLPPKGIAVRKPPSTRSRTASLILSWYNGFINPNGAIAELEELRPRLSFESTPETLEQALSDLSKLFGADGSRPENEYHRGPDNLWMWPELTWVIEVKHQRNILPKKDSGQMLAAMQWFKKFYPERRAIPIVVSKVVTPEPDAYFPEETRVLTLDRINILISNLRRFLSELVKQEPLFWRPQSINGLLQKHSLAPSQFAKNYTVLLKK